MKPTRAEDLPASRLPPRWRAVIFLLPLAIYATGMARDLGEPWIGMHDWNGAFFSQLARNQLRYPWDVHRGMPLVAAGPDAPAEERSIYATHPPGLVWLVAAAFAAFGESEAVARLVPIAFSLGALSLLIYLLHMAYSARVAFVAGLLYATMPMAVFFGRMVDHEAVCLACMLAAIAAISSWLSATDDMTQGRRAGWFAIFTIAILVGVLVDWSMVLFCGVLCAWTLLPRGKVRRPQIVAILAVCTAACGLMIAYLVYAGLAGRWGDLVAIFLSRSTQEPDGLLRRDVAAQGGPATYFLENLSPGVIVLAVAGCILLLWQSFRPRSRSAEPAGADAALLTSAKRGYERAQTAREMLWLIAITGIIWLLVFWRQFERHNYWMFYLGPAAATLGALGIVYLYQRLLSVRRVPAVVTAIIILAASITPALLGTQDYFSRRSRPANEPDAWRWIREHTTPAERVLLMRNPIREEVRGGYVFRNIIPPHMAWYLDRRLGVEPSPSRVPMRADDFAVYVIEGRDIEARGPEWLPLRAYFPKGDVVEELLFVIDLRVRRPDATGSRPVNPAGPADKPMSPRQ